MAALFNALKIVGKSLEDLRVLVVGLGAAGVAVTKMMLASGVSQVIGCDRQGALSTEREDYAAGEMTEIKRWYAENSNPDKLQGSPADVIEGCDLFIGVSGPGIIPRRGAGEDGRRRDRVRDGQPQPRGDAGGRRALRADHGHGPLRLSEPDQQRALLPGDLPGRARRRRATDHRGDEARGGQGHRRGGRTRRTSARTTSSPASSTATWRRRSPRRWSRRRAASGIARVSEETGTFPTLE